MHLNNVTRKYYTPLIIFTNLPNIFAYMTIIDRSMYNFVNCLQFNIKYEKVEFPAPVGGVLLFIKVLLTIFVYKYCDHKVQVILNMFYCEIA
jgi:hypothetical protein